MIDEDRKREYEKELQELSNSELEQKLNELEQVIIADDIHIDEIIRSSGE